MSNRVHLINRQILEFSCRKSEHAFQLQTKTDYVFQDRLLNSINNVCNELVRDNEQIRIDKLEIDLGIIFFEELNGNYAVRFQNAFKEKLAAQIYMQRSESKNFSIDKNGDVELVKIFMLTGNLPWWVNKQKPISLNQLIEDLLKQHPHELKQLLLKNANDKNFVSRLIYQFSEDQIREVTGLLLVPFDVIQFIEGIFISIKQGYSDLPNETSSAQIILKLIMNLLADSFLDLFSETDFKKAVNDFFKKEFPFHATENLFSEHIEQLIPSVFKQLSETISILKSEKELIQDNEEKEPGDDETSYRFYIQNAGLVLIVPFISKLFEELHLIEENNFISISHQQKALYVLHYLASGQTHSPEYTLQLNKILCGLELEDAIPPVAFLNEREIAECEQLLQDVIHHWNVLKNTTTRGLRESFLQRDGVLSFKNNHWLLQVERKSFDLLLDSLPWSWQQVQLSWMNTYIETEW